MTITANQNVATAAIGDKVDSGLGPKNPTIGKDRRVALPRDAGETTVTSPIYLHYAYRLYPDTAQRTALAKAFGCARVVFNDGLRAREEAYRLGSPYLTDSDLYKMVVTGAKKRPERSWLAEVSTVVLTQSLNDLRKAYRNCFASRAGKRPGRSVGPPHFKSKRDGRQSIRLTTNGFRLRDNGRLYVAKIGDLAVRWSRPLPAAPSSVTITKDGAGRYYAAFMVSVSSSPLPGHASEVGIDLGLSHFVALSDGTKVSSPRFLRRAEKKLKRLQQDLTRKQKGSANREKARAKLAMQHGRVADSRRDFHHKLSTTLIRENQAVYVEDLNVAGLGRTRLAKSVHDAGWGQFARMLEYKAARYGRTFAKVDRWAPTSQVCSACGVKDGKKPLSVRQWTCAACGAHHDRDVNAAKNVLALGRRERLNACGGNVRPVLVLADPSETGTHRDDRTKS